MMPVTAADHQRRHRRPGPAAAAPGGGGGGGSNGGTGAGRRRARGGRWPAAETCIRSGAISPKVGKLAPVVPEDL